MLLLLELLHEDRLLLVFAALVLEPDPDHPGAQAGHLHQLLLHQGVRPRVGVVARPQRVELLLVQHRPDPRRLLGLLVDVVPMRGLPHGHRVCMEGAGAKMCQKLSGRTASGILSRVLLWVDLVLAEGRKYPTA